MTVETIRIKELNPDIIHPSTTNYKDVTQGGHKIVCIGKPGCFALDTKILMYNGCIKNVQDVKVGEQVMGWDSTPRNVLELCGQVEKMYSIIPAEGKPIVVNKNHVLTLKNVQTGKVVDITVKDFLRKSIFYKKDYKWFRRGVDFPPVPIENDPYLIGMYFGKLTAVDVDSIPRQYKINSREIRLNFLAGLLDSNGCCEEEKLVFKHENKFLIADVVFVARSLGLRVEEKENCCSIFGSVMEEIPTKIEKPKNEFTKDLTTNFSLCPAGFSSYYGFVLDGDHRFLLADFSVVHNTGKTMLITSLLYAKKHIIPVGLVMSGTEDSNGFYRNIFPSTFVFNRYEESQLEKFIKRQKIAKQHLDNPWAVVILDDCTDDPALFRKPLQQGFYKRGRHWAMLYILSLQYGMDIRPVIRTNIDGVFILREPNLRNRRVMYENYGSIIPDFKLFCDILDQITDDFTALYIHNATHSNDWRDCVFWYKAAPVPENFKFGCPEYWAFHYHRYNPEYVDPIMI
jgi:hypothetical protein